MRPRVASAVLCALSLLGAHGLVARGGDPAAGWAAIWRLRIAAAAGPVSPGSSAD